MKLSYAFTADAATFTPADGRLWILGGDFDSINATEFPATHPAMTLVVKIIAQPTECERSRNLRIALLDADGNSIAPDIESQFTAQRNPQFPHRPVGIGLALNFQGLQFPNPGDYAFHILVDELELGVVPVYLVQLSHPE
jgi:hypothetical protein